jgi:hypothetical protein
MMNVYRIFGWRTSREQSLEDQVRRWEEYIKMDVRETG